MQPCVKHAARPQLFQSLKPSRITTTALSLAEQQPSNNLLLPQSYINSGLV
jgi:hypothetical protein